MKENTPAQIEASLASLQSITKSPPKIAIVLGSGLSAFGDSLDNQVRQPYQNIPHFPFGRVSGHSGCLILGQLPNTDIDILVLSGRAHLYEGFSVDEVVHPIRTIRRWGVEKLIITNAAGSIRKKMQPSELMHISDHINLTGQNPLVGPHLSEFGERFPDMSTAYDPDLGAILQSTARELDITLHQGIYAGFLGPSYETPAEVQMAKHIGAHAVGMSTVCEVIAGNQMGLQICGISCITNLAAGISDTPLHHDEVKWAAEQGRERFLTLLNAFIPKLAAQSPDGQS